jgi:hypothetical protein
MRASPELRAQITGRSDRQQEKQAKLLYTLQVMDTGLRFMWAARNLWPANCQLLQSL